MTFIDWAIVVVSMAFLIYIVAGSRKYMRSVADFLSAGRSAGRYLITVSQGTSMLGSITIVGMWEMYYISGFSLRWWEFLMAIVLLGITVSGWVIYRFRETRALTVAQFFEIRYSRNFRIFAGLLAFASGLINFGIFPAVGARFFIFFCGLPLSWNVLGVTVSSFPVVMFAFLSIALYFVFAGGQVAVLITEFIQGILTNAVFLTIVVICLFLVNWDQIFQAVTTVGANESLINPYHAQGVKDYNFWYFLIGMVGVIYTKMSWQGTQGYNSSAKSAHEAKMGEVLGNYRDIPKWLMLYTIPVVAFTILHNPDFSKTAVGVNAVLDSIANPTIRTQLTVPMVLANILPVGVMGALAAVMLMATIGTHDAYLHSWGSIFIQDVVMPFRSKPFEPKQHLRILRASIVGVCIFIFFFSLIFQQSEYIFLFFAITGAIFTGGSGAVIIGGLYWKRGTTAAAWSTLITGAVIAVGGIIIKQLNPDFPVNGQQFWGLAMLGSSVVYVVVSLAGGRREFNMDKMLHRGEYKVAEDTITGDVVPLKGFKMLGMTKEFTKGDRLIYILAYSWTALWTVVFLAGSYWNLSGDISDLSWMTFWKVFVLINTVASFAILVWFAVGGTRDLRDMLKRLDSAVRNHQDDGFVKREEGA
jgi:solute:Na+ symporter, SSS family